jgi:lipoprotein NlpI
LKAQALIARAAALTSQGNHEGARVNCRDAIRLKPKDPGVLRQMGLMQLCSQRYAEAAATLARSVRLDPKSGCAVLLLHLARLGAGEADEQELRANAARLNLDAWPNPIVRFCLGETGPDQLRAIANADPRTARERLGEAAFYMGEAALLRGEKASAASLLREAWELCPASFIESWAAAAELHRLRSEVAEAAYDVPLRG